MITGEEKTAVINCLNSLDCCSRCILRFLGIKADSSNYLDADNYLTDSQQDEMLDTPPTKKIKLNSCRICLGLLQDSTIEKLSENILPENANEYKHCSFTTSVSFPKCVLIRSRSIFLFLKEKFPKIYDTENALENFSKIFRISSSEIISRIINKIFCQGAKLVLFFEIDYEDDEVEVKNINKLSHLIRKGNQHSTSRNVIVDILNNCEDELFKQYFPVPASVPEKLPVSTINYQAEPIWLGGRYLKFSRDMGQTTWKIDGKLITENSVQDIIFYNIEKILGFDGAKLTFSASGREDSDVRMLGNGRPFYIQLDDPKDISVPLEKCKIIEKEILKTGLIAVVRLQQIYKNSIQRIKDGEEFKRKHYVALCKTKCAEIGSAVSVINNYKGEPLEISQKTPLRVLHRRSQANRKKYIYDMEANAVPGHSDLIEVRLVTQAGTYVKEFINGDFQRTTPNLSAILQIPLDVVALDVTKIELAWP